MKIFVNAYLENNLGDDLFFEILQNRYPNQEYYLLSSSYKTTNKNVHIISNEIIIKAIRKLQMKQIIANKCDINVVIGGSMYMETQNKIPKFSLGKNPYYILGANFGPYKTKEYFNAAHKFFADAQDVCFRESYSYELFKDLKNVRYASDIVFSLDTTNIKSTNNKRVVFSIISCKRKMNDSYASIYEKTIIDMTKYFINQGYEICYMSFCKKEGDEQAIEEIISKCDKETKQHISKYYYKGNIKEALEELANSQIIVGGRFHANILGMLLKKAVIPMMYSDKTKNVLEDMNFKGKILDIRKLDSFNAEEISKENMTYKQDCEFQIKDAQKHFEKLDKVLKN